MLLFVVRHAKAEDRSEEWSEDSQRPLTRSGAKKFKRIASRVGGLFDRPTVVLASSAVRAWETARILESAGDWPAPTRFAALECDHSDGMAETLQRLKESGEPALALVGHEPMLSELISDLLGSAEPSIVMNKGAIAVLHLPSFSFDDANSSGLFGTASLCALVDPKWIGAK